MTHVIDDEHDITRGTPPGSGGPESGGDEPREERERLLGLSVPQLLGGAGAAVSSAVVASYLGVAGTLIGAALGSIVSTVSAALYTDWARTAHDKLPSPRRLVVADGSRATTPLATQDPTSTTGTSTGVAAGSVVITAGRPRRTRHLRRLITGAVAVFALAVAMVTALELGIGHPFGNSQQRGGTSITSVGGTTEVTPSPKPTSTSTPSSSATPSDSATSATATDSASPANDGGASATSAPSDSTTTPPSDQQPTSIDGPAATSAPAPPPAS